MKASANHSAKPSDNGTKLKSAHEASDRASDQHWGSLLKGSRRSLYSRQVQSKATGLHSASLH